MEALQNTESVQQFLVLLEQNGRQGPAQDLSALMQYMNSMERQLNAVFQELEEVKAQLAQEKQPAVKKIMRGVAANLENKAERAQNMLAGLWERITNCARNAVEHFKEAGVSALDRAVSAMSVKSRLESLQEHLDGMIADTKRNMEKVENAGQELRSMGGHLKNAGRAMIGKETQIVTGGQAGRFQSVVLAPMQATQNLLIKMNNSTLATIGSVENLEQTAADAREIRAERLAQKPGKHMKKKPSILQTLVEKRAEAAARSASAPEKEHKAQEASL